MRLTLEALLVLDSIERNGSFSAAADALHRVPSAITYTVQKLEQDLDVRIFDRTGHRATLTPAGRVLLEEGRHLLHVATDLECRVKRAATGWEMELRIAVDSVLPFQGIYPLLEAFYRETPGTRVRLLREVYGGTWDALVSGRADLVVGAVGDGPPQGGFTTKPLGIVDFVFVVAPHHPLATCHEPLRSCDLIKYRAVSAADSSRQLPPRTSGLVNGQDILTVPDLYAKLEIQRLGIGVGYLPKHLVQADIAAGRLVTKTVAEPKPSMPISLAWRSGHNGKALIYFIKQMEHGLCTPWLGSDHRPEQGRDPPL